jgi:hypothetical protein
MKKVAMLFMILLTALAFGSGCATLGWKPTPEQVDQYESNLLIANSGELAVFIVFDTLCSSSILKPEQCTAGYAADTEWDNVYGLAMQAIADYRAGKTEAEMVQKYVRECTAAGVRIVALIKSILADKPATQALHSKGTKLAPKPPVVVPKK